MGDKPKITKIKKDKKPRQKITMTSLLWAAIALIITVVLFVGLLFLQNYLSDEVIYKSVVVAKTDIPENTIITKDNANKYLTMKNINILDTPAGALENADSLVNTKTRVGIYSNEIVTSNFVTDINKYTDNFVDPVEVSIPITSAENAVGGKIRPGDIINVTMMYSSEQVGKINTSYVSENTTSVAYENYLANHANDENILSEDEFMTLYGDSTTTVNASTHNYNSWADCVLQNVYVTRVLNASGEDIKSTDKDSVAATIIFSIERDSEQAVNNAIDNCLRLRISKVLSANAGSEFVESENTTVTEDSTIENSTVVSTEAEVTVEDTNTEEEPTTIVEDTNEETEVTTTVATEE